MFRLVAGIMMLATVSFADFATPNITVPDIDHGDVWTWGINYQLLPNEVITEATFTITDLYNVPDNINNAFYVDLIDNAKVGLNQIVYNDVDGLKDYFTDCDQLDRLNWNWDWYPNNGNDGLYSLRDAASGDLLAWENRKLISGSKDNQVVINFTQSERNALTTYLQDGNFGFGIDPDCHFEVGTFQFSMKTEVTNVPEPAGLSCLVLGLGLLAALARKNR